MKCGMICKKDGSLEDNSKVQKEIEDVDSQIKDFSLTRISQTVQEKDHKSHDKYCK